MTCLPSRAIDSTVPYVYKQAIGVTIRRNSAHQKLFPIIAHPYSLLTPPSDWYVVKLHNPELSPFTRFDLHVVKLQPRPDFT
jgi:hypothetical protein